MPDTASTTMTGASQGMAIGGPVGAAIGGVVGFFQGRSARRREQQRKRKEKAFAIKAQTGLINSTGAVRSEWAQRSEFIKEGRDADRASLMSQYQASQEQAMGTIGGTNLSYGGGAEMAKQRMDSDFLLKNKGMELGYKEKFFSTQLGAESELRDIQGGLLDLERTAMERGYKIDTKSINTSNNLGGYQ